jgi:hypothetical protein
VWMWTGRLVGGNGVTWSRRWMDALDDNVMHGWCVGGIDMIAQDTGPSFNPCSQWQTQGASSPAETTTWGLRAKLVILPKI